MMRKKYTLMIQGTTSDAGKSFLVAGLCRYFANMQMSVAPFKPQNMALNSAVTVEGGEIGRAQALQAKAAGIEPHTDMNPILLKPSSDQGAQVIVNGQAIGSMGAKEYHDYKPELKAAVLSAYHRLAERYDVIFVEGAGSPAEINLREGDIANMGFAEAVDCPVLLVADIDRGGVFAHIVGTLALLSETERKRVIGFVINRFRGDIAILQPGIDWLEKKTGKPVLGVVPYLKDFHLDAEDSMALDMQQSKAKDKHKKCLTLVIPRLSRLSNFTDFDPLALHPDIDLNFADLTQPPPPCDLVILPGSKNVRSDCEALKAAGWEDYLLKHLRYGGKLIGICGGFQMLGKTIADPHAIEGPAGTSFGFGFFPMHTVIAQQKTLTQVQGELELNQVKVSVSGYEIHAGVSEFETDASIIPLIQKQSGVDGVVSRDNQVLGTYLHGLFDLAEACDLLLGWSGLASNDRVSIDVVREASLNRLAEQVSKSLGFNKVGENALDRLFDANLFPQFFSFFLVGHHILHHCFSGVA